MPIKITAKTPGFRRCGIAHTATPTTYPDDAFTQDQIGILMAEPALVVEIVQDDDPDANPAEKKPGKKAKSEPGAE